MKKNTKKYLSVILAVTLVAGSAGIVYGLSGAGEDSGSQTSASAAADSGTSKLTEYEGSVDETVYVITGADGAVKETVVSDCFKDDKGEDAYSQDKVKKDLPVDIAVSYTLDGKKITPDKLAGKSGHVVVRFDYTNNQYETVQTGERNEKIYVPFAVLTGVILDNEHFTDVDVSNGKVFNDGNRTVVAGIAFPGLQTSLGADPDKLEIPEYVEISGDVKDFEMNTPMTVATNEVFNELDTSELNSLSDLSDSLGNLTDAMDKLLDGSSSLYDGLSELLRKSGDLTAGIDSLASGSLELKNGAADLSKGASDLQQGAASLYSGLNTLTENNDSLTGGAKQVFENLLSTANTQLASSGLDIPELTIDNYATVLGKVISSVDEKAVYQKALAQVTAAVENKRPDIVAGVTSAVKEQVTAQVTAAVQAEVTAQVEAAVREATGATDEQMATDSMKQTVSRKVSEKMASAEVRSMISSKVDEQMATEAVRKTIDENVEIQIQKAISENMASDAVQSQLKAASEGAASLISLKASLDSYNTFYLGLIAYTDGVADAAAGAGALKDGSDQLKDGASRLSAGTSGLYDGILTMQGSTPSLIDGITQLKNGSLKLSGGLEELNEKGIKKLVSAVDGDLGTLIDRLRSTVDVSRNYRSFTGNSDDAESRVKFIYKTEGIEAPEEE